VTQTHILFALAAIGVTGIACQWLAWWAKLPAILLLLLVGLLAGPVTGLLDPDALFAGLLFPMVSLSVAVILFEGSLTLRFKDIRGVSRVVRNLVSIGVLLSWLMIAAFTRLLFGFSWDLSLLFGALVVVTGPTVIIPMLRTVKPDPALANILRWEGIIIDPVGAVLAVLVFDFIIADRGAAFGGVLYNFLLIVASGIVVGLLAAGFLAWLLRRHLIPEFLQNVFVLTLVFGVFAIADGIEHESGLLAVTVMGIRLANITDINIENILDFKESLSLLLISGLFIVLAARLQPAQFEVMGWRAWTLLMLVIFLVRPLAVYASTIHSDLSRQQKILLAWIAPRGIVAAAISALFSLRLMEAGYPQAYLLVPLTFSIIIGTVVIQSITAGPLAQWLGVAEPSPRGVLLIAGNPVSQAIGRALVEQGFDVLLSDSNWDNISTARMNGLRTFYGNPISEHADRHMDLVGIGRVLALSGRAEFNTLASLRFRPEFGAKHIYEIQTSQDIEGQDKHALSTRHGGYRLFGEDVTYSRFASLLARGAEIRATQLTEAFDFDAYRETYGGRCIPLFAIDTRGRLHVFVVDGQLRPAAGWTVLGLVTPESSTAVDVSRVPASPERSDRRADEGKEGPSADR